MQTPQKGIVREARCPHENYCTAGEVTIREQGSKGAKNYKLTAAILYSRATNKVRSDHIVYR